MIEVEKLLKEKGNSQSLKESCTRTWGEFFRGYKKIKDTDLSQIATEMMDNHKYLKLYANKVQLNSTDKSKDLTGSMIKKLIASSNQVISSPLNNKKKKENLSLRYFNFDLL
jgi:hypothetical protein